MCVFGLFIKSHLQDVPRCPGGIPLAFLSLRTSFIPESSERPRSSQWGSPRRDDPPSGSSLLPPLTPPLVPSGDWAFRITLWHQKHSLMCFPLKEDWWLDPGKEGQITIYLLRQRVLKWKRHRLQSCTSFGSNFGFCCWSCKNSRNCRDLARWFAYL